MENKYLTVTALNRYIKAKIESDIHLNRIYITGELSNVKYHYSGHCYFTLKDEKSRINAVMFATQLKKVLFKLEDGMKVLAVCRLSVYEPQGAYQLYVEKIDVDGLGNLYMAYEKRRLLLEKEGLFSQSHKKNIPNFPHDIAIITASTGAAIHDIIRTIKINCPSAKMTLYPSLVQGEFASEMLIRRIKEADQNHHDVIIIGRGGGSLEDLWAFNDEALARTIYHASTPIISGVGHESDVTICDFVADLRAATPTAAANLATFNQADFELRLRNYEQKLTTIIHNKIHNKQKEITLYQQLPVFKHPEILYENAVLKNDDLFNRLNQSMANHLNTTSLKHSALQQQLLHKVNLVLKTESQKINYQKNELLSLSQQILKNKKQLLTTIVSQLNAYSPLNVLERGYTLTMQNNQVITKKAFLNREQPIVVNFSDGNITAYLKENQSNEENDL